MRYHTIVRKASTWQVRLPSSYRGVSTMRWQHPWRHYTNHAQHPPLQYTLIAFQRNAQLKKDLPSHLCNHSLASEVQQLADAFLPAPLSLLIARVLT
jgi:hypothetical protein